MSEPAPSATSGALALGLLSLVGAALPALVRVAPSGNVPASALGLVGATSLVGCGVLRLIAKLVGTPRPEE